MNKLNNERGSILVITTAFVLLFTMMGVASIYTASVQNEWVEKQRASDEAFWLADGFVEQARSIVPTLIPPTSNPPLAPNVLGNTRNYTIESKFDWYCLNGIKTLTDCASGTKTDYSNRWMAVSRGSVNNYWRNIQAIISRYNIGNAITVNGTVNSSCDEQGSNQILGPCEKGAGFSFESVFGVSKSTIVGSPGVTNYTDDTYSGNTYSGITVITNTSTNPNKKITFNAGELAGTGFLIMDCPNGQDPCVTINGGSFSGIIWVIGSARVQGNPSISGTFFAEGNLQNNVASGNSLVAFDDTSINNAVNLIPGLPTKKPVIVEWKEI